MMKEYSFQMTKEEVRELCFRTVWEKLLLHTFKCLLILAILILEYLFVSWTVALALIVFLILIFAVGIARRNSVMQEQLCERAQTMRVEDGMLKQDMEGGLHSEIRCSSITKVRRTRHLLMLGLRQAPKVIAWYPIPLRVFTDGQEQDRFLESVRNPRAAEESEILSAEDHGASATGKSEQEYFCVSYQVGEEEWIRAMAAAAEVVQAGTLGEQKNRFGWLVLAAVFSVFLCGAACFLPSLAVIIHIVSFLGTFIFLILLRNLLENPERNIREQLRKGTVQYNVSGVWETSFTEEGIRQSISGKNSVMMPWESLLCVVETDNELFFYQKDKRHFGMLPKGGLESREQVESLKELCREKHVEVLAGRRKKYVPNWFFTLLTAVVTVGYIWLVSGDFRKDTEPDYVSFDEQISVLRSFGFLIPEELEGDLYACMEENEVASYVERYPYTWLLSNLAWVGEEEQEGWSRDGVKIFWFDFEGWDICTDYIRILEGMRRLSAGSIMDDVENIREDTENMDLERGSGTITVSLEWNGQDHSWKMDVEHDWIDAEVLGIYNGLLEKEKVSERFYTAGDGGQGAFVFYCTGEWASAFEDATGLDMETYRVKEGW